MPRIAFINENTLGHGSYLNPLVRYFDAHPELGIETSSIDAVPLPEHLKRWGDLSIRGLRRFGLDFHASRWRFAASRHVRERVEELGRTQHLDGLVVNTQSVGLRLGDIGLPVYVCLDATFRQLSRSPWFCPNLLSRVCSGLTLAYLMSAERQLFEQAVGFFPWSESVRESLLEEYGISAEKIMVLPPSVDMPSAGSTWPGQAPAQILFVGGDFRRKGGDVLLDAFRTRLAKTFELHVVTQSALPDMPGVFVHRGIRAYSPEWQERWQKASVFVFPSALETFGIVLLEALAFGVPVVSSTAGAAREVLADGKAGVLVTSVSPESLATAVETVFHDKDATRCRIAEGRRRVEYNYSLPRNAERLASWLRSGQKLKTSEPALI